MRFNKGRLRFCQFPGHAEAQTCHARIIKFTAALFVEDIREADSDSDDVLSADGGEGTLVPTMI
ncbi:MAG: hypothetical protein COB66_00335 [Coxiella sp. (in: Bacteria)]|nr:MAG: hypothetical protein COB66_00335 [Coxiella sp. (in: g-proteobacteria)]